MKKSICFIILGLTIFLIIMNMVFYENGKKFVKEESYAWNEKEIYASDHLIGKNSFQEIKELNGADIDVNKEIKYVNIVNNLALVVFEKDNLNNGKIQFLLYSVDGRFLYGYQITPKNAARIQVGILAESEEICIFDPKFGYDYNDGKIRYGVTVIKSGGTLSYGFEYKQKKSEVEIYCKNEMTKEEIIIRFRSVICIYMQSCRFWAGGNNIQCMYVANDDYITEL